MKRRRVGPAGREAEPTRQGDHDGSVRLLWRVAARLRDEAKRESVRGDLEASGAVARHEAQKAVGSLWDGWGARGETLAATESGDDEDVDLAGFGL